MEEGQGTYHTENAVPRKHSQALKARLFQLAKDALVDTRPKGAGSLLGCSDGLWHVAWSLKGCCGSLKEIR